MSYIQPWVTSQPCEMFILKSVCYWVWGHKIRKEVHWKYGKSSVFIVTSTLQGRIILLYPINVTLGCISYFGQWNESGPTSCDLQAEVLEPACDLLCIFFSAMMTSHDSDRDNSISLGPGVRTPWSRGVDQPNCSQQWEIILCCCKRLTFGGIYYCSITYPILTITISKTLIIT